MPRSKAQREDDRRVLLAALAEAPVTDHAGRGVRFDQVMQAAIGDPCPGFTIQGRIRSDLNALQRAGLVVEYSPHAGARWSYWRLATPVDEDQREDAADIARQMARWEPA